MSYAHVSIESNTLPNDLQDELLAWLCTIPNHMFVNGFYLVGTSSPSAAEADDDGDGDDDDEGDDRNLLSIENFRDVEGGQRFHFFLSESCNILEFMRLGSCRKNENFEPPFGQHPFLKSTPLFLSEMCSSGGFRGGEPDNHMATLTIFDGRLYFDHSPNQSDEFWDDGGNLERLSLIYKIPPYFNESLSIASNLKIDVTPDDAFDDSEKVRDVLLKFGFYDRTAKELAANICGERYRDVKLEKKFADIELSGSDKNRLVQFVSDLSVALHPALRRGLQSANVSLFLECERNIVFHVSGNPGEAHVIVYDNDDTDKKARHYFHHVGLIDCDNNE